MLCVRLSSSGWGNVKRLNGLASVCASSSAWFGLGGVRATPGWCRASVALEGIKVSRETIRRIQMAMGLWKPKSRRVRRVFQLRDRRARFGELVQIDGSPHDWFEGRGPRCTLIVFIDDATSRLTALRFAPVESARAHLETLRCHVI
jgi:hypothetical protein